MTIHIRPQLAPSAARLFPAWLAICLLMLYLLLSTRYAEIRHDFDKESVALADAVQNKLITSDALLAGFAAFLQAVDQGDRAAVTRYAQVAIASHPHVSQLEVAREVVHDELPEFERELRRDWYYKFQARTLGSGKPQTPESRTGTAWPIIFMYPELPEAEQIYGLRVESIGVLAQSFAAAAALHGAVASPAIPLFGDKTGYLLLRRVDRPSASHAPDSPNFFGRSMLAQLIISAEALAPPERPATIGTSATLQTTAPAGSSPLFSQPAEPVDPLSKAFFPSLQRSLEVQVTGQSVLLHFDKQLSFAEFFTPALLSFAATLFAAFVMGLHLLQRHERSAKLSRSHLEQLHHAQRTARAGLWDWNFRKGEASWSEGFYRLLGLDPAVDRGDYQAWWSRVHPEDRRRAVLTMSRSIRAGLPMHNEYRIRLADGSIRWLRAYGQTEMDARGKPLRFSGVCLDVTDHALAELEKERYKQFFNAASDLMTIVGTDGRRLIANPAFCRTLGYDEADVVGQDVIELVHPDDRPSHRATFSKMLESGEPALFIHRYRCRNGSFRWLSWNTAFIRAEKLIYTVGRDVTALHDSEMALIQAKEAAEKASRTKSEFLTAVSHDLRQPIATINLFADALNKTALDAEQRHLTGNIERSALALSEMLGMLLAVARLDAGDVEARFTRSGSDALFSWIDEEFSALFVARKLRFKLHFPRPELLLETDAAQLRDILRNLIGNSLKFTLQGGVLISLRRRGEQALIQVFDTGIGIAAENQSRIFDEYYQVGNRERDSSKGIGLGLAIVKRKATLIGARISLRSSPGRGSSFSIHLPLAAGAGSPQGVANVPETWPDTATPELAPDELTAS